MKKFHIHIGVKDLKPAIGFYSALFGEAPVKEKADYAKWEPQDANIVFAISTRAQKLGVDHLGLRVDSNGELKEIATRLKNADLHVYDEGETSCCYARSNKAWVKDPAGIAWEAYQNMEDVDIFHESKNDEAACCSPAVGEKQKGSCC